MTIKDIKEGKYELWLHEKQKNGWIKGTDLLAYLKDNGLYEDCATLEDLEEIQKQGIDFFRKHFGGKYVFAWKGVRDRDGDLSVPCLCEDGDRVVLGWDWLDSVWVGSGPALRHASSTKNLKLSARTQSSDLCTLVISTEEKTALKSVLEKLLNNK